MGRRRLLVSGGFLSMLLRDGVRSAKPVNPMPADTRVDAVTFDVVRDVIEVLLSSEAWEGGTNCAHADIPLADNVWRTEAIEREALAAIEWSGNQWRDDVAGRCPACGGLETEGHRRITQNDLTEKPCPVAVALGRPMVADPDDEPEAEEVAGA